MCLFLGISFNLSSQVVADSLSKKGETYLEKKINTVFDSKLTPVYWLIGGSILSITGYAIYLFFIGIKKKVNVMIDPIVSKVIEEKLSAEFGIKAETLRTFFLDLESKQTAQKAKRILVLSKGGEKKNQILESIRNQGYVIPSLFWSLDTYKIKFDANNFDIIVFDNEDGKLGITEMTDIIENHNNGIKFVCYTLEDWDNLNYKKYNNIFIKFAKDQTRIGWQIDSWLAKN